MLFHLRVLYRKYIKQYKKGDLVKIIVQPPRYLCEAQLGIIVNIVGKRYLLNDKRHIKIYCIATQEIAIYPYYSIGYLWW
jgi:ribosomal protein L21E